MKINEPLDVAERNSVQVLKLFILKISGLDDGSHTAVFTLLTEEEKEVDLSTCHSVTPVSRLTVVPIILN